MKIKNNTISSGVWCGQTIEPNAYYTVPVLDLSKWQSDNIVVSDIAQNKLIINNETSDLDSATGLKFLLGQIVEVTKLAEPQPFAVPAYRTKYAATPGIITVAPNSNQEITYQLTQERYATGGALIVKNAVIGDYVEAYIKDVDSVIPLAYRPVLCENWPIVASYVEKAFVEINSEHSVMKINTYPLNAKINAGLYLVIKYYAVNYGSDRTLAVNYYLTKKL